MPFASLITTQQHLLWGKKSFEIDSVCEPHQPSVKNNWWTAVRWERGAIFITALRQKKVLHLQSDALLTPERQPFYRTLMLSVWVCPREVFFPTEYDAYAAETEAGLKLSTVYRCYHVCISKFIVKYGDFHPAQSHPHSLLQFLFCLPYFRSSPLAHPHPVFSASRELPPTFNWELGSALDFCLLKMQFFCFLTSLI